MNDLAVFMSHPDDEIIFGWPVMQDHFDGVKLIFGSATSEGAAAAKALWEPKGVEVVCLPFAARFGNEELIAGFCRSALEAVNATGCATVYTHNPYGEYGHPDHKLLYEIACQSEAKWVIVSDMWVRRTFAPWAGISDRTKRTWRRNRLSSCRLDLDWYETGKGHYQKHGAWTWSGEPIEECSLYYV